MIELTKQLVSLAMLCRVLDVECMHSVMIVMDMSVHVYLDLVRVVEPGQLLVSSERLHTPVQRLSPPDLSCTC